MHNVHDRDMNVCVSEVWFVSVNSSLINEQNNKQIKKQENPPSFLPTRNKIKCLNPHHLLPTPLPPKKKKGFKKRSKKEQNMTEIYKEATMV